MDFSFIKLYKNDFTSAKEQENPPIAKIKYEGFIIQKPNETFLQISNNDEGISFVGGITVDLVDNCNKVLQNINDRFFYSVFFDNNGIEQIAFEFGLVNKDYQTRPVRLKITDDINGNVWTSNSFLVTNRGVEISTRFDYSDTINDIYLKSIRIADCYDQTPANKKEVKQYITSQGLQVNYRGIVTYLRKYFIDNLDYFINDRLENLFTNRIIYANGERVIISEYEADERKNSSNLLNAEFLVNKQNQKLNYSSQLFPEFKLITKNPLGNYPNPLSFNEIKGTFNRDLVLSVGYLKVYKDNVLFLTFTQEDIIVLGNSFTIDTTGLFPDNGNYFIRISNRLFLSSLGESFAGISNNTDWTFEARIGDYLSSDYNYTDYLIY